jgi:hypothetical protein
MILIKGRSIALVFLLLLYKLPLYSHLEIGSSNSEINFREGPGANFILPIAILRSMT